MSTLLMVLVFALPVLGLIVSIVVGKRTLTVTKSARKAFSRHFLAFVMAMVFCLAFTALVSAETGDTATTATATTASESSDSGAGLAIGLGFLGAAASIGLASIGAGVALAGGAPAAIGAVSEDPKSFGKAIIFVALGEAIAIYGFIIAFLILVKIPTLTA